MLVRKNIVFCRRTPTLAVVPGFDVVLAAAADGAGVVSSATAHSYRPPRPTGSHSIYGHLGSDPHSSSPRFTFLHCGHIAGHATGAFGGNTTGGRQLFGQMLTPTQMPDKA